MNPTDLVINHGKSKIGIIKIQVEWDTPHDNQSKRKLHNLPRYGSTRTTKDLCPNTKTDLPVARVDVGGLVLSQHFPTVDVRLTIQHREPIQR